jgi:Cof subfamily protein (haloacid dehalogenase superfamily)
MSDRRPIKLIAVDVDGTLLNSKHKLSERNEAALRKAIAQGIEVVLATGKTRNSTMQYIEKLAMNAHGIYLQGLAIYDGEGKIHWQQTLDPALARQVITFAEDRGFTIIAYSGMRILTRARNAQMYDGMVKYHEPMPEEVGPLQNILNSMEIHKLMAIGEPQAIKALRWQLSLQLGTAARLVQAGVPEMVEILPPNGSKGTALKQLLKHLQIAPENVLAIGDAENDIEMIQLAGVGVAMGHAAQNVKDAANYVTGSNDEDGFAQALEKFVFPPEAPAEDKKAEKQGKAAKGESAEAVKPEASKPEQPKTPEAETKNNETKAETPEATS